MANTRILCGFALLVCATISSGQGPAPFGPLTAINSNGFGVPTDAGAGPGIYSEEPNQFEQLQLRSSGLLWWIGKDNAALPVLTTGGVGRGVLGEPDTSVLLRAGDIGPTGPFVGGDFGGHYWFDANQWFGLDSRFFFLGKRSDAFSAGGNPTGSPLLSIPFQDLNPVMPGPTLTQIANPGASTGQVRFETDTWLWGMEFAADLPSFGWERLELAGLVGFRFLNLSEGYSIVQDVISVGGQSLLAFQGVPIPGSDSLRIRDSFQTHNQFYGVNLVVRADYLLASGLSLGVTTKVALGQTNSVLNVAGSTEHLTPVSGQLATVGAANSGLFAQPNTIGRRANNASTVIPEVQARLAWDATNWLRFSFGYGFLHWSNVVRPASQIPGVINTTTAPSQATFGTGGPLPAPAAIRTSSLTVHGLNAGVSLHF